MDIIIYDTEKKLCTPEVSRLVEPCESGILVKGVTVDTLIALMENNTFSCKSCGKKVDIVDDKGDIVMRVRSQLCGDCYSELEEYWD